MILLKICYFFKYLLFTWDLHTTIVRRIAEIDRRIAHADKFNAHADKLTPEIVKFRAENASLILAGKIRQRIKSLFNL